MDTELTEGALDSRWIIAFGVLVALVAIVWALLETDVGSQAFMKPPTNTQPATVELLGVPSDAVVYLDGVEIDKPWFAVVPGTRHVLEVTDSDGRTWRQAFVTHGVLLLVVELQKRLDETIDVDMASTRGTILAIANPGSICGQHDSMTA